jgi:polyphosphate kinase 2 (PPK2 family)
MPFLLIFQGMDAAGKDGAIGHVMSGVNPQGCQVFSYKHPSATELQHDFLWRTTRDLPERGRIGIFNRSYYEEVLIARVHPAILRGEGLPDMPSDKKPVWHERYRSIVHLERHLHANGTRIIKFFLQCLDNPTSGSRGRISTGALSAQLQNCAARPSLSGTENANRRVAP